MSKSRHMRLNPAEVDGRLTSVENEDTLAYWIVAIQDADLGLRATTDEWTARLNSQFDAEDQASVGDDDAYGIPADVLAQVRLFAPVQLCRPWNAVESLCALLGDPSHFSVDESGPAFVGFWPAGKLVTQPALFAPAPVRRLAKLARLSLSLAPHLLFVIIPGYDYTDREMSKPARRALKIAGFLEKNRS